MPNYLSPGVYVEDVPPAMRPIAGVGTSTAGFIGIVDEGVKMPPVPGEYEKNENGTFKTDEGGNLIPILYKVAKEGEARFVTNWEDFKKNFGIKFEEGNRRLAHAVFGFLQNGGTACWVIRVKAASEFKNALKTFEAIDEIALVAIPGETEKATQEDLLTHCEKMQDRFAILDGNQSSVDKFSKTDIIGDLRNAKDGYGAVYFPWIKVNDPEKGEIAVPPSGHVAGIYARSDATRGVHKAPANEVISGALGVEHRLSKAHQDQLNPEGINVIRLFNGNVTVWGGRTWADPGTSAEWKYISTRRLMNYLRESIEDGMRWVVFEPNALGLWQKIRRNVSSFLANAWRDGALFGATPEEAFYVKCDAETNPPSVRDLGQVVTEIGVAIVNPAEFVVFRISQMAGN